MIAGEVGQISLGVGLVAALAGAASSLLSARRAGRTTPTSTATPTSRYGVGLMALAAATAFAALEWALVSHDYSVQFVAENSSRATPLLYTITGAWAGLEGSLILWLLVLAGYTAAVAYRRPRPGAELLRPVATGVLCSVAAFFFGLALFGGNAFHSVNPVPPDGLGPNPLLQNHPLMAVHPPLLYLGYVGATVPFAYAMAALATRSDSPAWIREIRSWTVVVWATLTAGIFLGAWWSYAVLGWGGYWAWDPVENGAIMPWLLATALLHSAMVYRRRGALPLWTATLAVATFLLVVLGTFFTRSGVLESVHAFTSSSLGPALLGFVFVAMVAALSLMSVRGAALGSTKILGAGIGRDTAIVVNNLLLVGMAAIVLLGTVSPIAMEAIRGERVSVGAPYFNHMALPLALAVLVLMGVGPLLPWAASNPGRVLHRLRIPAVLALLTVGVLGLLGMPHPQALLLFGAAAFVVGCIASDVVAELVLARSEGGLRRLMAARRRRYGGLVVHLGVALAAVAIGGSGFYTSHHDASLSSGESMTLAGYTVRLDGVSRHQDARRMQVAAKVTVAADGHELGHLQPALSYYPASTDAVGTPAILSRWTEDVYLTVSSVAQDGGSATLRVAVNPMVSWLWAAGGVMLSGCLVAMAPRRRSRAAVPAARSSSPRRDTAGVAP